MASIFIESPELKWITLGEDNSIVQFDCNAEDACRFSLTYAPNGFSTNVKYNCDATYSCYNVKLYDSIGNGYETNELSLELDCSNTFSCQRMDIQVTSINYTDISCTNGNACRTLSVWSSIGLGKLDLECDNSNACSSATIGITEEGDFDSINLDCLHPDAANTCPSVNIYTNNGSVIHTNITFIHMSIYKNYINIYCHNLIMVLYHIYLQVLNKWKLLYIQNFIQ